MFRKLFLSRNVFMLQLWSTRKRFANRISKLFDIGDCASEKSLLQNTKTPENPIQSMLKSVPFRNIYGTICTMKNDGSCDKKESKGKAPKCQHKHADKGQNKDNENKTDEKKCGPTINENPCKGKKNLAAILYKEHDLKIEEREKPSPCAGDVLIAMNCVGLCPSDLNYFTNGKLTAPLVLGREGTGIVAGLGQGVKNIREGDRVVIQPDVNCGNCEFCKTCDYNLCSRKKSYGIIPYDGLLTCYYTHPAKYVYKLPEHLTMEEGVLINMLANGIHLCSRCHVSIGSCVLIIGAGPIGLVSLIAAKSMGATNTCVMCKFQDRLKLANEYNTKTVHIFNNATPEDMAHLIRDKMGGSPSITIDSVGSEVSLKLAIAATAPGGTIALASVTDEEHKIRMFEVANRDISIRSALRQSNKFPAAVGLACTGSINLKRLISHHFYFEEVSKAFNTLIENQETANKVIVHIRPRNRNNKTPF